MRTSRKIFVELKLKLMDKQTLCALLQGKIFKIPDYQRGYAWEEKQLKDLIEDIDALVEDWPKGTHYAGTIVTFKVPAPEELENKTCLYNRKNAEVFDVVDGQQRLTSVILYLSVIIRALKGKEAAYDHEVAEFLYDGANVYRLTLNNDTQNLFTQLLEKGEPIALNDGKDTPHQILLVAATKIFKKHIEGRDFDTLETLFKVITGKLVFTYYEIEEESEIGMTFELMNARGKGLSILELLKNYFLHWVYRNGNDEDEKKSLTKHVNGTWHAVYFNIGAIDTEHVARTNITRNSSIDELCLRIAWTLHHDCQPKNWQKYEGFKEYIKLRVSGEKREKEKEKAQKDLKAFVSGLSEMSKHYSIVVSPHNLADEGDEREWLTKIHNTRNMAKFLPLMIAARVRYTKREIKRDDYIGLLKALECFSFRVHLLGRKMHSIAQSKFYRWGKDLLDGKILVNAIVGEVYALIGYYSPEEEFRNNMETPSTWYKDRKPALKYILFEYERHLCEKGADMEIKWKNVGDSTIEHILPQSPAPNSRWHKEWTKDEDEREKYCHDIGNLVLTHHNTDYSNKEFAEKKGRSGVDGYSNSNVRQELEIAQYDKWTKETLEKRRQKLVNWVVNRWKTEGVAPASDVNEEEDDEE